LKNIIMHMEPVLINLDSISIILVRPRFHENVGSVARAMKNMGLSRLLLVEGCCPLHANAYKLASGAEDILERAEEVPTLREAITDMGCVVGMTSRGGRGRSPLLKPEILVEKLIPISVKNLIALAFGSEKDGLTNEELALCHFYGRIPSSEGFPSLNLAQAVMVICYELFRSSVVVPENPVRLARAEQMEGMFEHMERTLLDIGFLDPNNPQRVMKALRQLFGRCQMEERDVQILRGIFSQMDWHLKKS